MVEAYKEVSCCRFCKYPNLTPFWSAGMIYVVDFPFQKNHPDQLKAPLTLVVCEKCWLVQLSHSVEPDRMYREFYYRSGMNEMMRAELREIATQAQNFAKLVDSDFVLDIGCNDGTLLKSYPSGKFFRHGIDPASNIQLAGNQGNWYFTNDYFNDAAVMKVSQGHKYRVVTSIAMFYDLEDPVSFVKQVKNVLDDNGVFVVQMNYLLTMMNNNCIDNACHEHLTYFSLTTLLKVFQEAGLEIFHAELNKTNGGSLRVLASHPKRHRVDHTVENIVMNEAMSGLKTLKPYHQFSRRVQDACGELSYTLVDIARGANPKKIYAYGASTRGTTLLQLIKNTDVIEGCAERAAEKFGRYMVGSWIPIVSETDAREDADVFLILPYHFLPAIWEREQAFIQKGKQFLVPLPWPLMMAKDTNLIAAGVSQ